MSQQSKVLLIDAVSGYVSTQVAADRRSIQGELNRFVRWCGRDRQASSLTPLEIESYCASLEGTGEDGSRRVAITRKFLSFLHNSGRTYENMASHAKLRRSNRATTAKRARKTEALVHLTQEAYQQLEAEIASLKEARPLVANELRLAAADKDVSDNAPLDAAREKQGYMEARIRELENMLQRAVILEKGKFGGPGGKAALGASVVLRQVESGREVTYLLVETNEADPGNGKLSVASPVGRAILNHVVGDNVDVVTPGGTVSYLVAKIQ